MINSRDIKKLHPKVAQMCNEFIAVCAAQGIIILITSTYRDIESQNALYEQGRTTPGKKVTNAKGGQSYHNWKVAFDFCPIVNGKAQWNDTATFNRCGEIAESLGLEWAGRWKGSMRELAHLQLTQGYNLAYFQNGGRLT
ncbi:MAG: M15 family metallopeptidase [Methylococcaceae bacterium]|jgi:peptidoglycan L-alanyl-D-glutamate endopeptidase CwlK